MARRSLRSQLNLIRTWVRQGRTDAWIAHQLEISAGELSEFKRQHDLAEEGTGNGEGADEPDLRDQIEAEVEAAAAREAEEAERRTAEEAREAEEARLAEEARRAETGEEDDGEEGEEAPAAEPEGEGGRRRRRRRGGRGRGRGRSAKGPYEATFDHGDQEGYGLWLDPVVQNDPVYGEHWAGHRPVKVTIEPERIVIERVDGDSE
jgi:hypothetical protein